LNSLLRQTRPPDEIVIVDDASDDNSRKLLEQYAARAKIIGFSERRGQAAAINAGYAATTSDLVLFLDADDMLYPEALETLALLHAPAFPLVYFGLETVDATGQSQGLHLPSMSAPDGDTRPSLLRSARFHGDYGFAPTSGNLFRRSFLDHVMPMPEDGWEICADAYLVRAAALHGPVRALRRVLGAYRVHGGNQYVRRENFLPWTLQRAQRDFCIGAEALLSLADHVPLPDAPECTAFVRLALRLRALEMLCGVAEWSGNPEKLVAAVRRSVGGVLREGMPRPERAAAIATLLTLARSATDGETIAGWAEGARPTSTFRWVPDGAQARLRMALAPLERPRWPEPLPLRTRITFEQGAVGRRLLGEGWTCAPDSLVSLHGRASLVFAIDPGTLSVSFDLSVAAASSTEVETPRLWVRGPAGTLWSGRDFGNLGFVWPRAGDLPGEAVRIELEARDESGAPAAFSIKSLLAVEVPPVPTFAHLHFDRPMPIAALRPRSEDWVVHWDGSAALQGHEATLPIAVSGSASPLELLLDLSDPVPRGWLVVRLENVEIFRGETGGSNRLRIDLSVTDLSGPTEARLHFDFTGLDPIGQMELRLAALTLREAAPHTGGPDILGYRHPAVTFLNVGEQLRPGYDARGKDLLRSGWSVLDGVAHNVAPEALISFHMPAEVEDARLKLVLRPAIPPSDGIRHVLGVSVGEKLLLAVDLAGEAEVEVPLLGAVPERGSELAIVLHSLYAPREPHVPRSAQVQAPFELLSIALLGQPASRRPHLAPPPPERHPPTGIISRLEDAAEVMRRGTGLEALLARRSALAWEIWGLDRGGLELIASRPEWTGAMCRLGEATDGLPLAPVEAEVVALMQGLAASIDPSARLRIALASMLLLPAFRMPLEPDIALLPGCLLRHSQQISHYLGREPAFDGVAAVTAHVDYLRRLLAGVERVLDTERPDALLYRMALHLLRELRLTKAVFGRDNLAALFRQRGRCIEKTLVHAGATLAMTDRERRSARRLRVGVMVRHLAPSPEAWAALGMYRCLDPERFDLVLITSHLPAADELANDVFPSCLKLAGLAVDEAVAAIRGLDLDLFILGAYTTGIERVAQICAHRLARLQVNACFNCPTTLGLASFDLAVAWGGISAPDPQAQYVERLVFTDAPLQCCFDFGALEGGGEGDDPHPAFDRIAPGGVRLVSGAMAHKILPELLSTWARILARCEGSQLILYPFAACWALPFSEEVFRRRVNDALDREGVGPDRVVILAAQTPQEVRRILARCDLYLDSFPYTGATTVCEALAEGVPVVTLEGEMLREQTGAAWLRAYDLPELIAADEASYVEIAARLIGDDAARAGARSKVARVLAAGTAPHADSERFGAALSDTLWGAAIDSGRFPGLSRAKAGPPTLQGRPAATAAARVRDRPALPQPVRTVVVTMPRTGSTALCQLIGQVEGAEMHYELFHATEIQYRDGPLEDPAALVVRDERPLEFLENVFLGAQRRGATLVGFKYFAFHTRSVLEHILRDRGTRLVVLGRDNALAQYASRKAAEATGRWERAVGEPGETMRPRFDAFDFECFERSVRVWTETIHGRLAAAGREGLTLEYDSMFSDTSIERLSAFLGVAVPAATNLRLARQNPERTIDRFSNPAEVRQYLEMRGNPGWAYCG
jgi:predicted O-linked N-acetylglucosamine transferase (SPINDLY family)/LPS sulfotransferase NodH